MFACKTLQPTDRGGRCIASFDRCNPARSIQSPAGSGGLVSLCQLDQRTIAWLHNVLDIPAKPARATPETHSNLDMQNISLFHYSLAGSMIRWICCLLGLIVCRLSSDP